MPGKLTLYPAQRASRSLVIRDGETLEIGRDPQCGLVLEDTRVSKRHARLRWSPPGGPSFARATRSASEG